MKALWMIPVGLVALVAVAAAASTASASEAKEQLPADIDAMVRSAEASKDPVQIEAVARAIKSKYPKTAATLENEAAEIRKAKGTAAGAAAGAGAQSAGQQAAGQTGTLRRVRLASPLAQAQRLLQARRARPEQASATRTARPHRASRPTSSRKSTTP